MYKYNYYSNSRLGKMGIEAYHNKELVNKTDNEDIFTKLDSLVSQTNTADLYLTIDDDYPV